MATKEGSGEAGSRCMSCGADITIINDAEARLSHISRAFGSSGPRREARVMEAVGRAIGGVRSISTDSEVRRVRDQLKKEADACETYGDYLESGRSAGLERAIELLDEAFPASATLPAGDPR